VREPNGIARLNYGRRIRDLAEAVRTSAKPPPDSRLTGEATKCPDVLVISMPNLVIDLFLQSARG